MSHEHIYNLWDLWLFKSNRTNNTDRNLFLFSTNDSSVIIEESDEKSILKHPTVYTTVNAINDLDQTHFTQQYLSLLLMIMSIN